MYEPTYTPLTFDNVIHIEQLYSIHYFEYMKDFSFPGEQHGFWEFLCVDKGEVGVLAGSTSHTLKKGDIIFHKPDEFHSVYTNGQIAPNLVVVSFACDSPLMSFFRERICEITDADRTLLAQIIHEARLCFETPLNDPYLLEMKRRSDAPIGCEQLIRLHLEELLLSIYRRVQISTPVTRPIKSTKKKNDDFIYTRILYYMEEHICRHLTIDLICRDNLIGRSQLQTLFRDRNKCGVIEFFFKMKIEEAKTKIREGDMNFSEISDHLGYTSIHYFSRQFKKVTGMTPSEYASSIKVISDNPQTD